jgi:hypothetical protein
MRKKGPLQRAAESLVPTAGSRVRVRPKATETVGKTKVTNRTAASIEVVVSEDGSVTVADCCLEEQGK